MREHTLPLKWAYLKLYKQGGSVGKDTPQALIQAVEDYAETVVKLADKMRKQELKETILPRHIKRVERKLRRDKEEQEEDKSFWDMTNNEVFGGKAK